MFLLSFVCKSKPSRAVRVEKEPAAALVLYELILHVIPSAQGSPFRSVDRDRLHPDRVVFGQVAKLDRIRIRQDRLTKVRRLRICLWCLCWSMLASVGIYENAFRCVDQCPADTVYPDRTTVMDRKCGF